MARLQNQFNRLAWELGNTLTPQVEAATRRIAGAANWMSRRSSAEQDAIGYGITGAAVLGGAKFLGLPVGGAIRGAAGLAGRGIAGIAGYGRTAAAIPTAAESAYIAQYGRVGLPAATAASGSLLSRAAGPLSLASMPIIGAFGSKYATDSQMENSARRNRGDLSGLGGIEGEYAKRWNGLSEDARKKAAREEYGRLIQQGEAANQERRGAGTFGGTTWLGQSINMLLGGRNAQNTGGINEAEDRQAIVRKAMTGQMLQRGDHRANSLIGGDFGEIGSGFYTAASALAKTGYGMNDADKSANQNSDPVVKVLTEIRDKLPNGDHPPNPGTGNKSGLGPRL